MKRYLNLTLEEATHLAESDGFYAEYHPETIDEAEWLEVYPGYGPGYGLDFKDGKTSEYYELDWN